MFKLFKMAAQASLREARIGASHFEVVRLCPLQLMIAYCSSRVRDLPESVARSASTARTHSFQVASICFYNFGCIANRRLLQVARRST